MLLSIVIVNFNTPELTANCIKSILRNTVDLDYEIILVDNSPALSYEQEFRAVSGRLSYFRTDSNIGFGRANCLGMNQAKGRYILLLNSDTIVFSDALGASVRFLESEQGASTDVLGIRLINEDGSFQHSFYPYTRFNFLNYCVSNNPLLARLFRVRRDFSEPTTTRRVGDVSGAFMMLRRKVFETTKGFDPDFFLYFEESEWCRGRILKSFRITYYPFASVIHLGGKSAPRNLMAIQAMVSQGLFWYKLSRLKFVLFIIYNMMNYVFYCLGMLFVSNQKRQIFLSNIRILNAAIPYWLFRIPRYSPKWGSRPEPLIYEGARRLFFNPA